MALNIASTIKLSSGQDLPLLGLGVYQNDECYPAVEAALKCGYRLIDTAHSYGNEEITGAAVKASGIPRESICIISKIYGNGSNTKSTVEASLKKLDLGYIDIYLMHSAHGGKDSRLETYKTLLEYAGPGKPLRSIGVSNFGVKHLEEIREAGLPIPVVNQIEVQPFCQQKPIVEYCQEHGIVIQAYCPLIRGQFDNQVIQEISKEYNKSPANVLLRWSIQNGYVPLPKSASADRVKSNADIYDFELSAAAMAKLDSLDLGTPGAISWNPTDVD